MKRNWKTMLRVGLLAGVLAASCCISASALTEGNFEYTLSGNEAHVTGLVQHTEVVNVPAKLGGVPVVSVTGMRELGNGTIREVTLPNTVKVIGENAFEGCKKLEEINMPTNLEELGWQALCSTAIDSVTLPNSVKKIGGRALSCVNLSRVKLPAGMTEIPEELFLDARSLKTIEIPATVKKIGNGAFARSGLTKVKIPSGAVIGDSAFNECKSLKEVELPAGLTRIENGTFAWNESLKTIYIPTTVTWIGLDAFQKSGLESVILPYGVKKMFLSFEGCENLREMYAPSTLEGVNGVPDNCLVYCAAGSNAERSCKAENYSYRIDPSVDALVHVLYNGKRISFGDQGQNPVIESGRTLVPLRAIFETMGATVDWDNATRTITATRGSTIVKLTLGDKTLYKNGKAVMTLDVPAKALNGRTVVPARAVAEAFGADVGWNAAARIVIITE